MSEFLTGATPYSDVEYLGVDAVRAVETGEVRVGLCLATDDEGGAWNVSMTRADARQLGRALLRLDRDMRYYLGDGDEE